MDAITNLTQVDFYYTFKQVIIILLAVKALLTLYEYFMTKFGLETKKMRQRREDHELLIKVSENLVELQNRHTEDERTFRKDLTDYMNESREDRKALHEEMSKFTENRIHDRQQSFEIQRELTDSMKRFADGQEERDRQIDALMCGSKELLGSTIDTLYSKYVALEGIPESEVDEFDDIFMAYKKLNGNHRRDTKYNYVKQHLPVIPVETKLITSIK